MKKIPRILVFKTSKKKDKAVLEVYLKKLRGIEISDSIWFFRSLKKGDNLYLEIKGLIPSNTYFYFFETHGYHLGEGDERVDLVIKGKGKWV